MKFYLASGIDNIKAATWLRDSLEGAGHICTYNWMAHGPAFDLGSEGLGAIAASELDGVKAADVVVVLLPGGRGTHAELGAALVLGKPVVIADPTGLEHLGSPGPGSCSFHYHPGVVRAISCQNKEAATDFPPSSLAFVAGILWEMLLTKEMGLAT